MNDTFCTIQVIVITCFLFENWIFNFIQNCSIKYKLMNNMIILQGKKNVFG